MPGGPGRLASGALGRPRDADTVGAPGVSAGQDDHQDGWWPSSPEPAPTSASRSVRPTARSV